MQPWRSSFGDPPHQRRVVFAEGHALRRHDAVRLVVLDAVYMTRIHRLSVIVVLTFIVTIVIAIVALVVVLRPIVVKSVVAT